MLQSVLAWLQENGPASLSGLAARFSIDISAMERILELLERKGRIQRLETRCSRCKGCAEVKPEDAAIFEYIPKAAEQPTGAHDQK